MMSYPSYNSDDKSLNHPNLLTLAVLCEKVGVDFRVLVLQRPAIEILYSTDRRHFGGSIEPRVLIDNAAVLSSQVRQLDPRYLHCLNYTALTHSAVPSPSSSSPTQSQLSLGREDGLSEEEVDSLAVFLNPRLKGERIRQMLSTIQPSSHHTDSPSPSDSESEPSLSELNLDYNEFHLHSHLRQIDEYCQFINNNVPVE